MLRNVLISLDSLLDTRIGTLRRTVPDDIEAMINTAEYRQRQHEDFTKLTSITAERWDDAWRLRDRVTLSKSKQTILIYELLNIVADIQAVIDNNNPELSDVRFLINTYPYKLSNNEKLDIIEAFSESLSLDAEVRTVNLSPALLSPGDCERMNIILMILYDFPEWVNANYGDHLNLTEDSLPKPNLSLSVVAPKINRNFDPMGVSELEDELLNDKDKLDWVVTTQEAFSLLFQLNFVSTNLFCELNADAQEKIAKAKQEKRNALYRHVNNDGTTSTPNASRDTNPIL